MVFSTDSNESHRTTIIFRVNSFAQHLDRTVAAPLDLLYSFNNFGGRLDESHTVRNLLRERNARGMRAKLDATVIDTIIIGGSSARQRRSKGRAASTAYAALDVEDSARRHHHPGKPNSERSL
jgi:hypothetical protein